MRLTDAPMEWSYHTIRLSKNILAQGARNMDACKDALEDRGCKNADNVDGDIEIEEKEFALDRERTIKMEHTTQDLDICSDVQEMIAG